jgi:hypothetical protein
MSPPPSRKTSLDTLVVEKGRFDLHFLANPEQFRQEVNLSGLTNSARESFSTLKLWQQASGCFDHHLVQTTITDVVEQSNKLHAAIKSSLTIAKQGHAFADDIVTLYRTLSEKGGSPERFNELLSKLTKAAGKAFKRSMRSCDELKDAREALFQIAKGITTRASKIEQDMLNLQDPDDDDTHFNGIDTCFITFPRNLATGQADTWPLANLYLGSKSEDDDSDDENAVTSKKQDILASWTSYPKPKHMSFVNVEAQLIRIAQGMLPFIEHFSRYVIWWGTMKGGLEGLNGVLPQLMLDGSKDTTDLINGWKGVGDQFALYVYKTTPVATDYIPHQRHPAQPMPPRLPPLPSPRPGSPPGTYSAVLPNKKLDSMDQKGKPKPLWKRLSCVM